MVNTMKTGQAFCQAVGSIIGKSIDEANFNTTRKGIITAVLEQATGKYQVRHQDADWIAYAPAEIKYSVDTEVSLVNTNNNTEEFYILGSINPSATEYTEIPSPNNSYDLIGMSLVNGQISLTSYLDKVYTLYKNENEDENTLVLNSSAMDAIRTSNGILLSANFQTNFNPGQYGGRYGLIFNLVFNDENEVDGFVTKTVALDFSNVIGNPYGLTRPTKVENLFIQIDPAKFHHIDSILAFTEGFNIIKNESDITQSDYDIRITNIKLNGANPLTQEQLTSYKMHINYSANGNKIDEDNLELKLVAQLKAKGVIINENVTYYWFRQNATIFRGSSKYSHFGGEGWECLNQFKGNSAVPLTTNQFYVLSKAKDSEQRLNIAEINQKETLIKCVGVYNKSNWIEGTVKILNDLISDDLKIVSSDLLSNGENKSKYYLDAGSPTLKCVFDIDKYLEGKEISKYSLTYTWLVAEKGKQAQKVEPIEEEDYQYNGRLKNAYNNVIDTLEKIPPAPDSEEEGRTKYLSENNNEIEGLTNQQVIDKYKSINNSYCYQDTYYNFPISSIINYKVISCGVDIEYYINSEGQEAAEPVQAYIGTASITIYNIHELANTYSLNIVNGTQVFQYDDKGNSPCSKSLEKPLQVPTLTFTLIDSEGGQVSHDLIRQNGIIRWSVPKENTLLLNPKGDDKATTADDNNNYVIENSSTLSYSIANQYDRNKKDNNIQLYLELQVNGQKIKIIGYTNLTFAKDGDPGTNGTDYVAKISPSEATDRVYISTQFPEEMFDDNGNTVDNLEFQLYNNSIKVNLDSVNNINYFKSLNKAENPYYGIGNGLVSGNKQTVTLTSSVDDRMLDSPHPVNILRGVYQQGDLKYYAEYPIIINYVTTSKSDTPQYYYRFKVKPKTGFKYVQYAEDGTSPNYDNLRPFEIIVQKYSNVGAKKQDGYFIQQDSGIVYEWSVVGNLKEITSVNSSTFSIEPKDTFNGDNLTSAICVKFYKQSKSPDNYLGYIYIPIYMYLNRYNNRALNDWDGNSIDLGTESGVILAPQIGAGKKEEDGTNTFTGVVMGRQLNSSNEEQVGLFGYEHGQRSIFLDSKTGKAQFGKQGAGKIIIDPRNDMAQIYSGNYTPATYGADGYTIKNRGAGMLIDLTEPYIDFGNGDFHVDSAGHITARGGGRIAGWQITDTALLSPSTTKASDSSSTYTPLKLGINQIVYKDKQAKDLFSVKNDGTASIAGWQFDKNKLHKNNVGINSVNSATKDGAIVANGKPMAFYAGLDNNNTTATKFYVTHDGFLKSVDGKIANWNITTASLNDGRTHLGDAAFPSSHSKNPFGQNITARIWSFASSQSDPNEGLNFALSNDGKIYSKAGKIGGWNISGNQLSANNIHLDSNGNMRSNNYTNTSTSKTGWSISGNGNAYFNQIQTNGMDATNMSATNATVSGKITTGDLTASGGTIGGITINNSSISGQGWWISSNSAHFNGLIVDNDGHVSSSQTATGFSGGSGGSGWNFPGGTSKPTMTYDNNVITPQPVKVVKKLALVILTNANMMIPTSIVEGKVATYVPVSQVATGWTNDTALQTVEAMISTPEEQSIG